MTGFDYSKDFLRRSGRTAAASTEAAVLFGKHPAWNDHMPVIGTATNDLAAVKELLYDGGVGAILDDPELHWDRLPAETCLPAFNHLFLWHRRSRLVAGALWDTSDGAGRRQYPLVLAVQHGSFSAGTDAAPLLECIQAARINLVGEDAAALRQTVAEVQRNDSLRPELARKAQAVVTALLAELGTLQLAPLADRAADRLARCGQADGVGLLRVVGRVQALLKRAKPDTSGMRFRADSVAHPKDGLSAWLDFLRIIVPEDMPILLVQPDGQPWVDVILGKPDPDDLRCLKQNLSGLVSEQSIETDFDDDERGAAENVVRAYLEQPAGAQSGPRALERAEGFWTLRVGLFPKWLLAAGALIFVIGVLAIVFRSPSRLAREPAGKSGPPVAATNRVVASPASGLPPTMPTPLPTTSPLLPESIRVNLPSGRVEIETSSRRVEIRHEAQDGKKHASPQFGFGRLILSELPPGQHTFSMNEPGFEPLSTNVVVTAGSTNRLLVQLTPLATQVVVENLMEKSTVQAENGMTNLVFPPASGSGFTAAKLPAGTWRLRISSDHELFGRAEASLTVTASSQQSVRIEAPRLLFPLGALQVSIPGGFERVWLDQRPFTAGKEPIGLLPAKAYSVVVEVRGYRPHTNPELIEVVAGRKSDLMLVPEQLTPLPGTIAVTVNPSFATTTLRASPSGAVISRMESGAVRQATNLSVGAYIFEASADGLDARRLQFNLGPGAIVNSNLTLEFGAIQLAVEPAEALVRVDNRVLKPGLQLVHLKPMATTIEATMPGFQTGKSNVIVVAGQTNLLTLRLKAEPARSPPVAPGEGGQGHVTKEFGAMTFVWVPNAPGGSRWPNHGDSGIWVGKYEVTHQQFDLVMSDSPPPSGGSSKPSKLPVTNVSREEVTCFQERFTRFLVQRGQLAEQFSVGLPTHDQWRHYCGPTNLNQMVTSPNPNRPEKLPLVVGSRPPNALGLHDVFGNVAELVWASPKRDKLLSIGGSHSTVLHDELEIPQPFQSKSALIGFRCVILPGAKPAK